jgi:hypothetical protein
MKASKRNAALPRAASDLRDTRQTFQGSDTQDASRAPASYSLIRSGRVFGFLLHPLDARNAPFPCQRNTEDRNLGSALPSFEVRPLAYLLRHSLLFRRGMAG